MLHAYLRSNYVYFQRNKRNGLAIGCILRTMLLHRSCKDSNQHVEAFLNGNNGIRVMWTPDSQYRVTQSAYNAAARSQTVIPLRKPRCVPFGASG